MKKVIGILFLLHALALSFSIAAMEISSWLLFALAVGGFAYEMKQGKAKFSSLALGPDRALWGYFLVAAVGVLFLPEKSLDRVTILGFMRWILVLYALSYSLSWLSEAQRARAVRVLVFGATVAALYGTLQFFTGWEFFRSREVVFSFGNFWRPVGFFSQPLTFAYSLGMATFLGGGFLVSSISLKNQKAGWGLLVSSLSGFAGILLSLTRGAWLGALVTFPLLLMGLRRRLRWVLLGGLGLSLFLVILFNPVVRGRLVSVVNSHNHSNELRRAVWHSNWEIFKDHPWLGVGLTRNADYLLEYYEKLGYPFDFVGHAHNNFLQMLTGTGIFGFLFFCFFNFYFIRMALQLWRTSKIYSFAWSLGLGALAAQVFLHMGGLTECNFTDGEVNHMLVFVWALLIAQSKRNEISEKGEM